MKRIKIRKGFHRPLSLIPACFRYMGDSKGSQKIAMTLVFTDSCRYYLNGGDQRDWNKLFGFGYGWKGIHQNSARFVWRYDPGTDKIEIATYYYINGQREYEIVRKVSLNKETHFEIERDRNRVWFYIDGEFMDYNDAFVIKKRCLMFGCYVYFGGNRKAPQDIVILKI